MSIQANKISNTFKAEKEQYQQRFFAKACDVAVMTNLGGSVRGFTIVVALVSLAEHMIRDIRISVKFTPELQFSVQMFSTSV